MPCGLGRVKGVVTLDSERHPQNSSSTRYDIEVNINVPGDHRTINCPDVPMMGRGETPLAQDDYVYVQFVNGDPDNPFILGLAENVENGGKTPAQTSDEYPKYHWDINGVDVVVDKSGAVTIKVPSGQQLAVQDENGAQLFKVDANGQVEAGTSAGDRLLTDDFATAFNVVVQAATDPVAYLGALKAAFANPVTGLLTKKTSKLRGE